MLTEKNKQALIVGGVIAVLLGFLVGYYYFASLGPQLASNQRMIDKAKTDTTAAQTEIDRFKKFLANKEERDAMQKRVEEAKRRLPSSERGDEFLGLLRDGMRKTGVNVTFINPPSAPIPRTTYNELVFDIKGSARYHEFGQFLNLIECHPQRFMRVRSFAITKNDKRPSIHPIEVSIATFLFRES